MADGAEFQPGQRVRVREEGGAPSSEPPKRWLGKEGTIQYGTGRPVEAGPPTFYFVEFDRAPFLDNVMAISADWLGPSATRAPAGLARLLHSQRLKLRRRISQYAPRVGEGYEEAPLPLLRLPFVDLRLSVQK